MNATIRRSLTTAALVLSCADKTADPVCLTNAPEPKGDLVMHTFGWGGEVPFYRDGDEFMMIDHSPLDPGIVHAWGIGRLNEIGQQRLADALAQVDASMTESSSDCPHWSDESVSILHYDGREIEFLSHCPPIGFEALVLFYQDLTSALSVCPLSNYWAETGEEPPDFVVSIDCDSIYSSSRDDDLANSPACW
jgi:hypothetical protein